LYTDFISHHRLVCAPASPSPCPVEPARFLCKPSHRASILILKPVPVLVPDLGPDLGPSLILKPAVVARLAAARRGRSHSRRRILTPLQLSGPEFRKIFPISILRRILSAACGV